MFTPLQSENGTRKIFRRGPLVSAALHVSAISLLVLVAAKVPRVVPVHNPGTAAGKHLLLTYSTGAAPSVAESSLTRQAATIPRKAEQKDSAPLASAAESKPLAEQGTGTAGLSGLGDGNMTIAALKVHPRPEPDLSTLSKGHDGNIILDAIIDAQSSISQLTVVQSLSDSIDQQIMATVRGWSFAPATRNGQPVPSEQQIVLHYERA